MDVQWCYLINLLRRIYVMDFDSNALLEGKLPIETGEDKWVKTGIEMKDDKAESSIPKHFITPMTMMIVMMMLMTASSYTL